MNDLPGIRFIEVYSRKNEKNRWYERFPEEQYNGDGFFNVAAWPSVVGGTPRQRIQRLSVEPASKLHASGICVLESPAFIQMTIARPPNERFIGPREIRYWTEKTARQFGKTDFDEAQIDEVDWGQLKHITRKILSYVKRSSCKRWNSKPVLAGCAEALKGGSKKLWFWGQEGLPYV
jgi:hypothetical protein